QTYPLHAPPQVTKRKSDREYDKYQHRRHHDQQPHKKHYHARCQLETIRDCVTQAASETRRANSYQLWRLNVHCNRGKTRTVLEEALAPFKFFDVRSDFGNLPLHLERVGHFVCLFHDLQKLEFDGLLRLDASFEIDEIFGHILTGDVRLGDVARQFLDLFERRAELSGGNASYEFYVEGSFRRVHVLALLCL